jgi:sialate O-acetylesterase
VQAKEVKNPVAVRFAWNNTAEPNLFNKAGLPASTFRTDDWPVNMQTNAN